MTIQPKLLRALEERTVRPVGGDGERAFDARIVAATNRDLESAIEDRSFREDLYYRLNVIQVSIPPLRERGTDALRLARHFVDAHASRAGKEVRDIATSAVEKLLDYPWPGNVRELANAMNRAVALARFDTIAVEDLPPRIREHRGRDTIVIGDDPAALLPLAELERRYVLRVLEAVGGNRTRAARILNLDRKTLYRKLRDYGPAEPR